MTVETLRIQYTNDKSVSRDLHFNYDIFVKELVHKQFKFKFKSYNNGMDSNLSKEKAYAIAHSFVHKFILLGLESKVKSN